MPDCLPLTPRQYWGWSKFRYREEEKNSFAEAKAVARKWLDACPVDVIRRFINRTWRFIDSYHDGLGDEAQAWASKPQKQHRTTSNTAMVALEKGVGSRIAPAQK